MIVNYSYACATTLCSHKYARYPRVFDYENTVQKLHFVTSTVCSINNGELLGHCLDEKGPNMDGEI